MGFYIPRPAPATPVPPMDKGNTVTKTGIIELMENSVMIDPSIIGGWFVAEDGLVIIGKDFKQITIPMSYMSAVENAKFLTERLDVIVIDKRPLNR